MPPAIEVVSDDILESIFFLATEWPAEELEFGHIPPLAQVNQHWRHLSTASPRVWRNLGKVMANSSDWRTQDHKERLMERLVVCIQRSNPYPITFSLHAYQFWRDDLQTATRIFSQLCDISYRWQDVTLTLSTPLFLELKSVAKRVSALRNVRIISALEEELPRPLQLDWFKDARMLRSFDISLKDYRRPVCLALPWSQLDHFGSSGEHLVEYVDIFEGPRSNLRSLEFVVEDKLFQSWNPSIPWPIENLTVLRVRFLTEEYLEILQFLYLPRLTELSVQSGDPQRLIQGVLSLIDNSACVLDALTMLCGGRDSFEDGEGKLRLLLNSCSDLLKLHISPSLAVIASRYLESVNDHGSRRSPCLPRLQALTISPPRWNLFQNDQFSHTDTLVAIGNMAGARATMHNIGLTARPRIRILTVSVSCPDIGYCHSVLDSLPHLPVGESEPMDKVWRWRCALNRAEYPSIGWRAKMKEILTFGMTISEMERYEVNILNMRKLCVTNFPGFLHHLLLLWVSVRTENGTRKMSNLDYKLQQRLQALFDKWRPLLIEDTRANRRWSRKEREYLEYIDDIEKASWTDDEKVWDVVVSHYSKKHHPFCPGYEWPF